MWARRIGDGAVPPVRAGAASIGHAEAAALPLTVFTARQALVDTAGVRAGQRVLIHAAGGGVGHLAVRIARHPGAETVASRAVSPGAVSAVSSAASA